MIIKVKCDSGGGDDDKISFSKTTINLFPKQPQVSAEKIHQVRSLMLCLQAKKFVESLPQVIKEKGSKKDIEEIKKSIEAAGGVVEIQDEQQFS